VRDCGQPKKPTIVAKSGCVIRPVHARVRGRQVRSVTFYLDGRHFKTVRRPDARGRFGVLLDRRTLKPGEHLLRAKVVFKRRAHRRPEFLKMTIRRCLASAPPKTLEAGPGAACGAEPFRAWVRGDRIRRVAFRVDGRRLGVVTVADWRGRYGTTIDPSSLGRGAHEITARIEFVARAGLRARTVRLRFTKCR
jgi:hypothetical protein